VRVFRQKSTLEDAIAIGSHAFSLEANMRVTNGIPLGSSLLLPVDTVNCVAPLKADVWSLGITLVELANLQFPYDLYSALRSLSTNAP
jgi:serine/threonine protein kinase